VAEASSGRSYPSQPLVAVGAIVWDGERVALARRSKPPSKDRWTLPGGKVELGETAEHAAKREVLEECGINVEIGPLVALFQPIVRDGDGHVQYHYVVLDFLAYYRDGVLTRGDDAADVRWVPAAELAECDIMPETRKVIGKALTMVGYEPNPFPDA